MTNVERGDKQATLTWTAPDNPDCEGLSGYEIIRFRNGGQDAVTPVPDGTLTWVSAPLNNGDEYAFEVRAQNRDGFGNNSPRSATVIPCGVPQNVPTPTVERGDTIATVNWVGDADANGCDIEQYRYQLNTGAEGPITSGQNSPASPTAPTTPSPSPPSTNKAKAPHHQTATPSLQQDHPSPQP